MPSLLSEPLSSWSATRNWAIIVAAVCVLGSGCAGSSETASSSTTATTTLTKTPDEEFADALHNVDIEGRGGTTFDNDPALISWGHNACALLTQHRGDPEWNDNRVASATKNDAGAYASQENMAFMLRQAKLYICPEAVMPTRAPPATPPPTGPTVRSAVIDVTLPAGSTSSGSDNGLESWTVPLEPAAEAADMSPQLPITGPYHGLQACPDNQDNSDPDFIQWHWADAQEVIVVSVAANYLSAGVRGTGSDVTIQKVPAQTGCN